MPDKIVKQDVEDMLSAFLETPAEPPAEPPPAEPPPAEPPAEPPVEPPAEPPVEPKLGEPPVEPKPGEPPAEPPAEPPVEPPAEPPDPRLAKPPVEPPAEPPVEPTEMELLQRQNQLLLERIEKISGGEPAPAAEPAPAPAEPKPGEPAPAEPPAEPAPVAAPPAEIKIDEINFLEGRSREEIERIVENPVELNKVLNQVYLKAIERSIPLAQERSLLSIPQVVTAHIQRYNRLKGLVDDFYKENKDLKIVQKSVGMIANEVHSEHTDWTTKQVFDEAAVRTRKALGLAEPPPKPPGDPNAPVVPAVPGAGEPPPDPAFAGPRGSRQRGPAGAKLSGMAKEIDDLMPDKG